MLGGFKKLASTGTLVAHGIVVGAIATSDQWQQMQTVEWSEKLIFCCVQ